MAEYIEREAVCSDCKNKKVCVDKSVCPVGRAPAADVEVVKHGRWEDGKCTVCDFDIRGLTDGESDLEQWVWGEGLPYCPNCGAKMTEVTNGLDQH